jgi:iron complex transport system substrate-binding protein
MREEFGASFREHLATLRLERAKSLLATTDLRVIEVAGHTGWSSLAHFNSVFREQVGLTPSGFRTGAMALSGP